MRLVTGISIVLLIALVALTMACSSPVPIQVEPTPNIDATVEAKVVIELTKITALIPDPTPTPNPTRTPSTFSLNEGRHERDWMINQLYQEIPVVMSLLKKGGSNLHTPYWEEYAKLHVPVYLASSCLEDKRPTVEDFHSFSKRTVSNKLNIYQSANDLITRLIELGKGIDQDKLAAHPCLSFYLFPESMADARLALELQLAKSAGGLYIDMRSTFEDLLKTRAAGWFTHSGEKESFISWISHW